MSSGVFCRSRQEQPPTSWLPARASPRSQAAPGAEEEAAPSPESCWALSHPALPGLQRPRGPRSPHFLPALPTSPRCHQPPAATLRSLPSRKCVVSGFLQTPREPAPVLLFPRRPCCGDTWPSPETGGWGSTLLCPALPHSSSRILPALSSWGPPTPSPFPLQSGTPASSCHTLNPKTWALEAPRCPRP